MQGTRAQLLYERWLDLAEARRAGTALRDLATGASLTFGDLLAEVQRHPRGQRGLLRPVVAGSWRFVVEVLVAWRDGTVLLPLEPSAKAPALPAASPPDAACHAKTTSGSTGVPRLIWLSASQMAADADQIVPAMGLEPGVPNLAAISMAHSYGFSNLVLPLLLHGIPLELAPNPLPATIAACLRRAGGRRAVAAVPSLWRAWLAAGAVDGGAVATAISAGAPLPVDLEQEAFRSAGLRIHNFLGASECGGIAYDASPGPRTDPTLAGRPLPAAAVATAPDGRIIVRGPAVGLGYADGADGLGDGVFTTSDLGYVSAAGAVHLTGRVSDLIHVAGRKLSPARVEDVLAACPGVLHCLVFGTASADPVRGEEIVAVLAPGPGFALDAAKAHCGARLEAWECPRHWWVTDTLAPDARGKIPRSGWQAAWLARGSGRSTARPG